eukprot:6079804-Alexandrium_andersonii.AAC.1
MHDAIVFPFIAAASVPPPPPDPPPRADRAARHRVASQCAAGRAVWERTLATRFGNTAVVWDP